ncbi:MAG: hypothetical protein U0237_07025 [Thermoleophilia bacterium]
MPGSILIIPAESMVPEWADRGISRFEEYLANHAAFEEWLTGRRETLLAAA